MPTGSAMRIASASATPDIRRCSATRFGMLSTPCQRSGCPSHITTAAKKLTASSPQARPRRRPPLQTDERCIDDDRDDHGQHSTDDDEGRKELVDTRQDEV